MTNKELREQWAERLAAFKASGQSTTEWCAVHDVKPNQLRYWLRKEKNQTQVETTWLPLSLSETDAQASLLVKVGQATVEVRPGFDSKLLLDVVKTLMAQ